MRTNKCNAKLRKLKAKDCPDEGYFNRHIRAFLGLEYEIVF